MTMKNTPISPELEKLLAESKPLSEITDANSHCPDAFGSDLRIRDEDGYVINENRCDSCDGDGYHVTEVGTDYICDHCKGSGLL